MMLIKVSQTFLDQYVLAALPIANMFSSLVDIGVSQPGANMNPLSEPTASMTL